MQQGSLPLEQLTAETGWTAHHKRRRIPTSGSLSRMAPSLNAKAHPHRARPIGCSGQQHLFNASIGMVLVPLPSCSKHPCPWSNGRRRLDQRPTKSSVTSPMGAFVKFSKRNQNGPFLECKPKNMSQWRQRTSQSLGTGGPRARNARPFLRGTGNPHFWITEQDGPFS